MAAAGFSPSQPLNFVLCFNYTELRKLNTRLFFGFILLMGLGLFVFNRVWGLDKILDIRLNPWSGGGTDLVAELFGRQNEAAESVAAKRIFGRSDESEPGRSLPALQYLAGIEPAPTEYQSAALPTEL
jgi:hypothetical protein